MVSEWTFDNCTSLHIELSNYCNASCLVCPRYQGSSRKLNPNLTLAMMSIEQFKKYFPPLIIKRTKNIIFCGTSGDPGTCKDLIEILEYVYSVNENISMMLLTNGGMRNADFWYEVGKISSKYAFQVYFNFDGLEDTNHLYRRNVVWEKAFGNAKSFISAGGKAVWVFLVFEHNKHQKEKAIAMSSDEGFIRIDFKEPYGFREDKDASPFMVAYDQHGNKEYVIYKQKNDGLLNTNLPADAEKMSFDIDTSLIIKNTEKNYDEWQDIENKKVKCNMHRDDFSEIYISANGIVIPCCYLGASAEPWIVNDSVIERQVFEILESNKDKLDLKKNSLMEVLESGILNKLFTEKWKLKTFQKGKIAACTRICGVGQTVLIRRNIEDPVLSYTDV